MLSCGQSKPILHFDTDITENNDNLQFIKWFVRFSLVKDLSDW